MFSSRLQGPSRNRLALALERRRATGLPIVDLTESNPTRAGFDYPPALLAPLAQPRALRYEPDAFGLPDARRAVSADFRRRGVQLPPEHVVLTASTSEAYSLLFKLLCNPGDRVLAPRPSYPLVEHLAQLDAVEVEPYSLEFHGAWSVDVDAIARKLKDAGGAGRIRAVITISPNNPTGSVVKPSELEALASLAREHDVALISDEVFADYPIARDADGKAPRVSSALDQNAALTFGLGGLSKCVGLPQVKLGWIGVGGPDALVDEALDRLETICDTYLSVSTPVQTAAAELLDQGSIVRAQIQERVRENYGWLRDIAAAHPACSVLPVEAGWYAVVQVPAVVPEETFVVELLDRAGVLVHPGYFFDFEREAFLVASLLPPPETFSSGASLMLSEIGRMS